MRDILRIRLDNLLRGLLRGICLVVGFTLIELGGLRGPVVQRGTAQPAGQMLALFAGAAFRAVRLGRQVIRLQMQGDMDDNLRRRLLFSVQHRRRCERSSLVVRVAGPQQP